MCLGLFPFPPPPPIKSSGGRGYQSRSNELITCLMARILLWFRCAGFRHKGQGRSGCRKKRRTVEKQKVVRRLYENLEWILRIPVDTGSVRLGSQDSESFLWAAMKSEEAWLEGSEG